MKFQFSIRELLMIVAIIALAAGWWFEHRRIDAITAQQKWEFKIDDCYDPATMLKNYTAQGWEVCGAFMYATNPNSLQVILKRRLP